MNSKKIKIAFVFAFILLLVINSFSLLAYAHPGKTDEFGGHFDGETGEYHYHHGYEAHQHPNGICPYDYNDNAEHSGGSPSSEITSEYTTKKHQSTTEHNIRPKSNNTDSLTEQSTGDNVFPIVFFSMLLGLLLVFSLIGVFHTIRENIRRKRALHYSSILKPQLEKIKKDETALLHKQYNHLNMQLNSFIKRKYNLDRLNYIKLFSEHTIEELCGTPKGIKIINDKIIDEMSDEVYGRYTAYKTSNGKAIHFKKGCSGSNIPINLLSFNYSDKRKKPCKICYSPKKANLMKQYPEWYLKYIEIVQIRKKYNIDPDIHNSK